MNTTKDVMVLTTVECRQQLKVLSALGCGTMKDILAALVAAEFKRQMPARKLRASKGKS